MRPAFPDIRAMRGLTNSVEIEGARQLLEIVIVIAGWRTRFQPLRLASRCFRRKIDLDKTRSPGHCRHGLKFNCSALEREQLPEKATRVHRGRPFRWRGNYRAIVRYMMPLRITNTGASGGGGSR